MESPDPVDAPDDAIHSRLGTQLRRLGLDHDEVPAQQEAWRRLLEKISDTYREIEERRADPTFSPQRLVETAPELIFSLAANDGRITFLNPAFDTLTGYPRAAWIGGSLIPLIHPADLERTFKHLQEALDGRTPPGFEARIRTRSGTSCSTEITLSPLREKSQVVGIRGTARDLAGSRRRTPQETEITALLRDVERELRTALDGLAGASNGDAETPRRQLAELSQRLQDLTDPQHDRPDLDRQVIDLREILAEAVDQSGVSSLVDACESRVLHPEPLLLLGRRTRLLRILTALLNRLRSGCEEEGRRWRHVELCAETHEVRPELCEVLFSLRAEADEASSEATEADLASHRNPDLTIGDLNKRLIESMGGEIKHAVSSERLWRCAFSLRLAMAEAKRDGEPAVAAAEAAAADRAPAAEKPAARRTSARVLVAEAHPVHAKVLSLMLERQGHSTEIVDSGLAALDALNLESFDLLLLASDLPELDGFDTARSVRLRPWTTRRRPSIVLLAEDLPEDSQQENVDAVLQKPLDLDTARDQIELLLEGRRSPEGADESAEPDVRLEPLQQLYALQPETVIELTENFLANASRQIAKIERAVIEQDCEELRGIAHSLKGSSSTLGAVRLAEHCRTLERRSRDRATEDFEERVEALLKEFGKVESIFRRQLAVWNGDTTDPR